MARPQLYSEKQILDRLRIHLIDNMGSVWTMHKPSWEGIKKRMAKDESFGDLVRDCICEANYYWEKMGIDALKGDNTDFNTGLYKHFTANKKSFLSHEVLELESRIQELEDAKPKE